MKIMFVGNKHDAKDGSAGVSFYGVDFPLNQAVDVSKLTDFQKGKLRNNHHFRVVEEAAPKPAAAPAPVSVSAPQAAPSASAAVEGAPAVAAAPAGAPPTAPVALAAVEPDPVAQSQAKAPPRPARVPRASA